MDVEPQFVLIPGISWRSLSTFEHSCSLSVQNLRVCASCGVSEFGFERNRYLRLRGSTLASDRQWCRLQCTNDTALLRAWPHLKCFAHINGQSGPVWQCDCCRHAPASCRTERFMPQCDVTYAHNLATTRFEYLNTMSFVDCEYQILNEARGYAHGKLTGRSLLHAPLLLLSDAATEHRPFPTALNRVVKTLYEENILYSIFKPLFAQKHHWQRQFLPPQCWTSILKNHQRRDPVQRNHSDSEGVMVAIITNPSQRLLDEPKMKVGTLCPLDSSKSISTICSDPNGAFEPASNEIDPFSLSIEFAMFPSFFPRNTGFFTRIKEAHGSRFSFSRYVKFRCKQAFSIFTRHFHYLLLLRAMDLAFETIKGAARIRVFTNDYKRLKRLHPHLSHMQLLDKIVKEKIRRAIVHSPHFYRTGYRNLLTKAREYGLPHYFVTITMDDASENATAEYRTVGDFMHNW
jgi:hypothetical protein